MKKKILAHYIDCLKKEGLTLKNSINDKKILLKPIEGIYADSRKCKNGGIFFCKGRGFLPEYLVNAIKKGCIAVIYEKNGENDFFMYKKNFPECIFVEVYNVRKAMAVISAFHYDYPMKRAVSIAVTGTKGKTGTVTAIKAALNEKKGIKAMILNEALPTDSPHLTTPEPIEFHAAAAKCIEYGATHIVCEVSSQGIKTLRTYGIIFDIACFLNFGIDHISPYEHPNVDDYFYSKASLFLFCKRAVINLDCNRSQEIIRIAEESKNMMVDPVTGDKEIYTFSFGKNEATFCAEVIEENECGSFIDINEKNNSQIKKVNDVNNDYLTQDDMGINNYGFNTVIKYKKSHVGKEIDAETKDQLLYINTVGIFNAQNALACYSVCRILGVQPNEIFKGVFTAKPEGRMEIFDTADGYVRVIVDYAHNKMSFEALFNAVSSMYGGNPPKITAVFGASGEKAYGRRYELPEVALKFSDRIIICEEDSGRESFESIKCDILANIKALLLSGSKNGENAAKISVIKDREIALNTAVMSAFENGERRLILFTGKGRESTMRTENGEIPILSDVSITKNAIKNYNKRLSLDRLFSKLSKKKGKCITVCADQHEDIIENFAESAFKLLHAGINIIAVCSKKSEQILKESCFKNGIICNILEFNFLKHGKNPKLTDIEKHIDGPSEIGMSAVIIEKDEVKRAAVEISIREKTDALVYLTRSGGIILNGRVCASVFSERGATVISEKIDSEYLKLALRATEGGVKTVAVIDGREKYGLAFYGIGSGYNGTVIKKK